MMFDYHLHLWDLVPDGESINTSTSSLLPVRIGNVLAMLKVVVLDEEKRAGELMSWWDGQGAARVLAYDDTGLLLERAQNDNSLVVLAQNGGDAEASRIVCATVACLHARRSYPLPNLVPLKQWFEALESTAAGNGDILRRCASIASELLATLQDVTVLHGDIHHGNILDFGARGWLAIDPKGLVGERAFDYANLCCNPDIETATAPGRLARQVDVITGEAGLERRRLLSWVVAWAGLSAAFLIQVDLPPNDALRMAELAAAELGQ